MTPKGDGPAMAEAHAGMKDAAAEFDWQTVGRLAKAYATLVRATNGIQPAVFKVLTLLQNNRQYAAVMDVADAALAVAPENRTAWRHYAQALVDQGRTFPALRIYSGIADDPAALADDRAEALGGVGRCYKQLFLAATDSGMQSDYLRQAVDAYGALYRADRSHYWHGINVAALLTRAGQESIAVPGYSEPAKLARDTAAEVLAIVDCPENPWEIATACEAHVARDEVEAAASRAREVADDEATDAFVLGSLLRQLVEVWRVEPESPVGTRVLPILRSALTSKSGGGVILNTQDVSAGRLSSLEKVFGADRYQTLQWWRNGLSRCRAVARIDDLNGVGRGTGFLVRGSDLHTSLPELVVMTNGHVVPDAVTEDDARVTFHGLDNDAAGSSQFKVRHLCWYSPPGHRTVDTALLELDGTPKDVEPLPLVKKWPTLNKESRTYIIGHPRGYEQPQFSVQDNLLLDYDDTRLHYRSPTEGGSSGSPVFESQWTVIGLHHAGSATMSQLHNKGGTYQANEALRIDAIRTAMHDSLSGL
jgi:tetratricopeptide (TPR) repeat protein